MTETLNLTLYGDTQHLRLNNAWLRWTNRHAAAAHTRRLRAETAAAVTEMLENGTATACHAPCYIVAQLTTATRRFPDADAIAITCKHIIDGIVDAGALPDDSPEHVRSVTYLHPIKTGRRSIRIRIHH